MRLEHGTNTVKHEKGSNLSKLTTNYTLSGDYRDVRRFIYSIETAPEFIVLENVSLRRRHQHTQDRGLGMTLNDGHLFPDGDRRR